MRKDTKKRKGEVRKVLKGKNCLKIKLIYEKNNYTQYQRKQYQHFLDFEKIMLHWIY